MDDAVSKLVTLLVDTPARWHIMLESLREKENSEPFELKYFLILFRLSELTEYQGNHGPV